MEVAVDPEIDPNVFFAVLEFLYTGFVPAELRADESQVTMVASFATAHKMSSLVNLLQTPSKLKNSYFFLIFF